MKIFFSMTYYDPYVSGLSICAKRIAESLQQRGHTVSVVCMRHNAHLPTKQTIHGVSVTRAVPFVSFHKGFLSFDFWRQMYLAIVGCDVVVIHLPQAEGWMVALFGKLLKKRVVSVYHCELVLPKGLVNSVIQWFLELSHRITFFYSDCIVSYTKDYANHSRLLQPFHKKITAIYPPVPIPAIRVGVVKNLTKRIGTHTVIVGVAARLAAEKGIEYLIEALPLLSRDTVIVIAGPMEPVGEERYKKQIFSLVHRYKKQVIFLGTLSQQEIGAFYSLLDVLVLPSINSTEAFGLVQVEAMLCGIPVVASDLPGVREPIQKTGMGIIVPKQNSERIAQAIRAIMHKRSAYLATTRTIQSVFSYEHTIDAYERCFTS